MMITTVITTIKNKYNALALRQRIIISLMLLTLIYFFWTFLFDLPIQKAIQKASADNAYLITLYEQTNAKITAINHAEYTADIAALNKRFDALLTEEKRLDETLTKHFLMHNKNEGLLRIISELVDTDAGLTLEGIEQLPKEFILLTKDTQTQKKQAGPNNQAEKAAAALLTPKKDPDNTDFFIQKNRIHITLKGNYKSIANYLAKIASLDGGLFAQDIHYNASKYPETITHIILYTLSFPEGDHDA